jgi:hypothetical protein
MLSWEKRQLADINLGFGSSFPRYFTVYKDHIYYQATDNEHGAELWRDEGLVIDMIVIFILFFPYLLRIIGLIESEEHLGISELFLDLNPGESSSYPSSLAVHNGFLYFAADGRDLSWFVYHLHCTLTLMYLNSCRLFVLIRFCSLLALFSCLCRIIPQQHHDDCQSFRVSSFNDKIRFAVRSSLLI